MTESEIKSDILKYLSLLEKQTGQVWAWSNPTMGVYDTKRQCFRSTAGLKGSSDILGIYKGKPLAVEIKTPEAKKAFFGNTKDLHVLRQKWFLDKFNKRGGLAFVACCIKDVEEKLF